MLKGKPLFALVALLLNAVLMVGLALAAVAPDGFLTSRAVAEGLVRLELSVAPAVLRPGDSSELLLRATNQSNRAALPAIRFDLPPNVRFATGDLPSSTTYNVRDHQIVWQPVLAANSSEHFALPLRVTIAELQQPIQIITATMRIGDVDQQVRAEFWSGLPASGQIRSVEQVAIGQPIQLYAAIEGPGPVEQTWDLGDGRIFRAENPFVAFAAAGDHTITLEVANPLGSTRSTRVVRVVPEPAALFAPDDPTPGVDQPITFQNQSGGAAPLRYYWEFGDGAVSRDPNPEYRYAAAGSYDVRLTVENGFGQHVMTLPLTVGTAPTAAIDIADVGKVGTPLTLRASGDSTISEWRWDLGDGRRTVGASAEHIYRRPGSYTITLFAANAYGTTAVLHSVTIEQGMLSLFLPFLPHSWQAGGAPDDSIPAADATLRQISFEPIDLSAAVPPAGSTPEQRLLFYINKAREAVGLPELAFSAALSTAAKRHTNDMAFNRFRGHTGSDGSRPAERLVAAGYSGFYGGEATGWGYAYPSRMVEFWLNSPDHRPMILSQFANEVGVAFTYDESAPSIYYWTAELGYNPDRPRGPIVALETPTAEPAAELIAELPPAIVAAPVVTLTATPTVAVTLTPTLAIVSLPTATPDARPTLTPTLAALPTELPLPTQTPTATPSATPSPTQPSPIVTATPVGSAPIATPTASATPGPSPTPTLEPTPSPTPPRIIVATPQPTATPDERSGSASPAAETARAFVDALLADAQGYRALPYATYTLQERLVAEGSLGVLQLASQPLRHTLGGAQAVGSSQQIVVSFWLSDDGAPLTRVLTLVPVGEQWRVDSVALPTP